MRNFGGIKCLLMFDECHYLKHSPSPSTCKGCILTPGRASVFFNKLFEQNILHTPNCNRRLLVNFPEIVINRRPSFSLPEHRYHPAICLFFHYEQGGRLTSTNM